MLERIGVSSLEDLFETVPQSLRRRAELKLPSPLTERSLLEHLRSRAAVNLPVRAQTGSWSLRLAEAVGLPTRPENSATAHYNLALAYAARAKGSDESAELLARAEAQFREALRQEPGHVRILVELGKVLSRQQRNAEAIEVYRQAAALQPNDYRIHHALGRLYGRLGDQAAARDAFRRALRLNPSDHSAARALEELEGKHPPDSPSDP